MKAFLIRLGLVALPLLAIASSACRSTRSTPSEVAPPPASEVAVAPAQATRVSSGEAKRLVTEGASLLDVRTPEEFAAGHLDGATNFPLQRLEAGEAPAIERDRPVIVYCHTGRRSAKSAAALLKLGFTQVYDLGAKPAQF